MQRQFRCQIGLSDHTAGIGAAVASVALGATVIEKHFTLDRTLAGPDHKASLEPNELKSMIDGIRNVEEALGDGLKRFMPSEVNNRDVSRKSVVARLPIIAGQVLNEENLTTKRPGSGISPMDWDNLIGKKAHRDYSVDELIDET